MIRISRRAAAGLLAAALAACGGSEEPAAPTGPAMGSGVAESETRANAAEERAAENRAPRIAAVTIEPPSPRPGETVTAKVESSDPDGDAVAVEYHWRVGGRAIGASGERALLSGCRKGDLVEVVVVARDGQAQSEPASAKVRVGNQQPILLGVRLEPQLVTGADDLVATPEVRDPDGDPIRYEYAWRVNGRRVGRNDAVLSSDQFSRGDSIELTVVARDGEDESEPIRSAAIEVRNAAPEITSRPLGLDAEGVFRYQVQVADADDEPRLRYRLLEGPDGMGMDAVNGTLTWEPGSDQTGTHPVEIEVSDMHGGKARQRFTLDVGLETAPASPGS